MLSILGATNQSSLHKEAVTQQSKGRRVFKDLGVAKRYCSINSIGDTFVQRWSVMEDQDTTA